MTTMPSYILNGEDFGFTSSDSQAGGNAGSLNAMFAAMQPGWTALLPPGVFKFSTKPHPIPAGCELRGAAYLGTELIRSYVPAILSEFFIEIGGGCASLRSLVINADDGTTGGIPYGGIATNAVYAGGISLLEDISSSGIGAGIWYRMCYFEGSARTAGIPGGAPGIRSLIARNLRGFQAQETGFFLSACKAFIGEGLDFVSTPTWPSYGGLMLTGSDSIYCDSPIISATNLGDIILDKTTNAIINVSFARKITFEATATGCQVNVGGEAQPTLDANGKLGGYGNILKTNGTWYYSPS